MECWVLTRPTRPTLNLDASTHPRYVSPDQDSPNLGVLAAEGIRGIADMFKNYMGRHEGHGVIRLEVPETITSSPLKVYTYIPLTGQILVRHISGDVAAPTSAKTTAAARKPKTRALEPAAVPAAGADEDDANEGTPVKPFFSVSQRGDRRLSSAKGAAKRKSENAAAPPSKKCR